MKNRKTTMGELRLSKEQVKAIAVAVIDAADAEENAKKPVKKPAAPRKPKEKK